MARQEAPPYFALHPLKFMGDPHISAMSTPAVGAFMLLVCKAWGQTPGGSLPKDDAVLARWAQMSDLQWIGVRTEVLAAFKDVGDRWVCQWLTDEYRRVRGILRAKSDGGKAGAASKWGKRGIPNGIPTGMPMAAEQSRAEEKRNTTAKAAAGVIFNGILPALPATGRDALLRCRVGNPALDILGPLVTPEEVHRTLQGIRPGRANAIGVLVSELCKAHHVALPRKRAERVSDLTHAVVAKLTGDAAKDMAAARERIARLRRQQ